MLLQPLMRLASAWTSWLVVNDQTELGCLSPPRRRRLCPVTSVASEVAPNLVRVPQLGGAVPHDIGCCSEPRRASVRQLERPVVVLSVFHESTPTFDFDRRQL